MILYIIFLLLLTIYGSGSMGGNVISEGSLDRVIELVREHVPVCGASPPHLKDDDLWTHIKNIIAEELHVKPKAECRDFFTNIGGSCLMVETLQKGGWSEMNNFCHQIGGRLAVLDDANLLYELIRFIYDKGLSVDDFWIGATDEEEEGTFRWVDGNLVKMGSPYWGYYDDGHEPEGGENQNCALLWKPYYYDFADIPCHEAHGCICEQVD